MLSFFDQLTRQLLTVNFFFNAKTLSQCVQIKARNLSLIKKIISRKNVSTEKHFIFEVAKRHVYR